MTQNHMTEDERQRVKQRIERDLAPRNTTTAIQPYWGDPRSIDEALALAEHIVSSGLTPSAVKTPAQALVIMMTGAELGMSPMGALRQIHVIEGRPSLSADLLVALVLKSGFAEHFSCVESTNDRAVWSTRRRGESHEVECEWTFGDAKRANLVNKDNWKKYPRAMLSHRASAELARRVYPDVVGGHYTPDEIEERRDSELLFVRDVTPTAPAEPVAAAQTANNPATPKPARELATPKPARELATIDDVACLYNEIRAVLKLGDTAEDTERAREFALEAGVVLPKTRGEIAEVGFAPSDVSAVRNALAEHERAEQAMSEIDEVPDEDTERR